MSPNTNTIPTKPCPSVLHLHISWTSPRMVTPLPPGQLVSIPQHSSWGFFFQYPICLSIYLSFFFHTYCSEIVNEQHLCFFMNSSCFFMSCLFSLLWRWGCKEGDNSPSCLDRIHQVDKLKVCFHSCAECLECLLIHCALGYSMVLQSESSTYNSAQSNIISHTAFPMLQKARNLHHWVVSHTGSQVGIIFKSRLWKFLVNSWFKLYELLEI